MTNEQILAYLAIFWISYATYKFLKFVGKWIAKKRIEQEAFLEKNPKTKEEQYRESVVLLLCLIAFILITKSWS